MAVPVNDGQALDRRWWWREIEPGGLAAGDLDPVVGWSHAADRGHDQNRGAR